MRLLPVGPDHAGGGPSSPPTPIPPDSEIVEAMDGNLCRCATYSHIVGAVRRAAEIAREET